MEQAQRIEEAKKIFERLNEVFKESGSSIYVPMVLVDNDLIFIPRATGS